MMKTPCFGSHFGLTLLLSFLLSFPLPLRSDTRSVWNALQSPEYAWKNLTFEGKTAAVHCLFTDSRGLMWLGTNQGLYCYDGVTLHPIDHETTSSLQVHTLAEGENGLYLGTHEGLFRYDFRSNNLQPVSSLLPKEIRSLLRIGSTLWIGSLFGAYTYGIDTSTMVCRSQGLPHPSVYSLLHDSQGNLYAGTFEGLARWQPETETFQPVNIPPLDNGSGSSHPQRFINCLWEDARTHELYLGCEGCLLRYIPQTDHWQAIPSLQRQTVKSLGQTPDGQLLVGTDNGLFVLDGTIAHHYRHDSGQARSLSNDEIGCIHSPKPGWIAVGHAKGMSLTARSQAIRTYSWSTLSHSGEGNDLYALFRDSQGMWWMGGTNGLLRCSPQGTSRWYRPSTFPPSLGHKRVRSIQEDHEGQVWLTTDAGLHRYDRKADRFDRFVVTDSLGHYPANWVYALVEEPDSFWIGSYLGGLHHIAKSRFSSSTPILKADASLNTSHPFFRTDSLPLKNNLVSQLQRDRQGRLWILCFRDPTLYCLTVDQGCRSYDIQALTGQGPSHILLDAAHRLWCTVRGGAVVFEASQAPRYIRFPETGSDEEPVAVGKVEDDVWVSTSNKVWKIDGPTGNVSLLPLPQRTFTAIYHDPVTRQVYLGGTDELLVVDPTMLQREPSDTFPSLVLVQQGKEPLSFADLQEGKKLQTLPYEGELTVTISSLNYTPDEVQRYAYRLTQETDTPATSWKLLPEGTNRLTLSNLAMGKHGIQVKRVGTPAPSLVIPLWVESPWYLSSTAIGSYLLTLATLIACLLGYLHRRQQRQLQEAERKQALESAERKLTFLANLSNDLKTPLTQITDRICRLKQCVQESETRKDLETVYDHTLRLNQQLQRALEQQQAIRIHPLTEVQPIEAESSTEKQLACIARLIDEHFGNPDLNVHFLSEKSGIAPKTLYRLLKKYQGQAPLDYIRQIRLQKAALLLEQHRFTVAEVCFLVGFNTPSYFAKCFQKHYGMKPSEYGSKEASLLSTEEKRIDQSDEKSR